MHRISLHCANWHSSDDFYNALFNALGAPDWHGRNFNALRDSIAAGGINRIEPPYCFELTGFSCIGPDAKKIVLDFCDLIRQLQEAGCPVSMTVIEDRRA